MRKVEVVPHSLKWREIFEIESKQVNDALGKNVLAVHHIGSTAIFGIYAKPIIDLLVEVEDLVRADEQNRSMELLGYKVMGEFGIIDRRFFLKDDQLGVRTHHIHTFKVGSAQIKRHLGFRDYLIAHPEYAQKYSELKRKLAKEYPNNIEGYMNGKDRFIQEMDRQASQWLTADAESESESGSCAGIGR